MITAADVLNAKFRSTKFRDGYDQDQVDDFLDRVVVTLRAREGGPASDRPVTLAELDALAFATARWREGYEPADVDELLDRVRVELGGASSAGAPQATSRSASPPDEAIPGLLETKGRWRRLFGG